MAYKRVYSPDGEPFDVPDYRANELILQDGWTQQPVEVAEKVPAEKPKSRRRSNKSVDKTPVVKEKKSVKEPVENRTEEEELFTFGDEPAANIDDK